MKRRILIIFIAFIAFLVIFIKYRMNQSDPKILLPLLTKIEHTIDLRDAKNKAVSKADVAWHLDHMLKTINRLSESLESSDPTMYHSSFNVPRIMSLTGGIIPRGRAQSPQNVRPPENILTENIHAQILEAKDNIQKLENLDANANFDHPVFGMLNKAQTIRFLEVHTAHHLKIIADILDSE
ncbi:DUF1569 domain-containing protein [Kordia sp.]|uniref:DUF1569 domain-containing protein n=1 Tax=Kordia sp. TaxID=1965332 RepID=UPI003B593473